MELKGGMTTRPILKLLGFEKSFRVDYDASKIGIDGALSQKVIL